MNNQDYRYYFEKINFNIYKILSNEKLSKSNDNIILFSFTHCLSEKSKKRKIHDIKEFDYEKHIFRYERYTKIDYSKKIYHDII